MTSITVLFPWWTSLFQHVWERIIIYFDSGTIYVLIYCTFNDLHWREPLVVCISIALMSSLEYFCFTKLLILRIKNIGFHWLIYLYIFIICLYLFSYIIVRNSMDFVKKLYEKTIKNRKFYFPTVSYYGKNNFYYKIL